MLLLVAFLVENLDDRVLRLVFRLDDHLFTEARLFVELVAVGDVLDDVLEGDLTVVFRDDNRIVRIPFADQVALFHQVAVVHIECRAVLQVVRIEYDVGVDIDDAHLREAADDHIDLFACFVLALDGAQIVDLEAAFVAGNDTVVGCHTSGDTTDVEGTQRQLGTRLADGLRGDYADHFAFLYHACGSQVAAVALRTDALAGFAGQYRTDIDRFDTGGIDSRSDIFGDLFSGGDDQFARVRVVHVVHGGTSDNAFVEGLHHVFIALDGRSRQAAKRAAVLFADDHVLRYVDQTTRQVTGVGRLQCGIGQTFTGTVRRDEVLQYRQTLFEVRKDRVFDDLTAFCSRFLRFGHQAAHTGKLANLLFRTTGSRVQHHIDRIETLHVRGEVVEHRLGQLHVDIGPDIDDLVVTLVVGDKTHVVALHHLVHAFVALLYQLVFLFGDDDRVEVERQAALERHLITEVLDRVEELGSLVGTGFLHHQCDDVAQ